MPLPAGRLSSDELHLAKRLRASMPTFMSSPTATVVMLLDGRILFYNAAAARLIGYTKDELIGVEVSCLVEAPEQTGVRSRLTAFGLGNATGDLTAPESYRSTPAIFRRDGQRLELHAVTVLLRDSAGQPIALLARLVINLARSETEDFGPRLGQPDAEIAAHALRELPGFEELAEPANLTNAEGVLLHVNAAFTRDFGWDNRDVVGLTAADLAAPELHGWAEQRLEEITGATILPGPAKTRLRHVDGRAFEVHACSIPVRDEYGRTRYVVTSFGLVAGAVKPRKKSSSRARSRPGPSRTGGRRRRPAPA